LLIAEVFPFVEHASSFENQKSIALQSSVLIRLPDTLRRTDSLEGRKAGKMCRKRSFSAFLPSKSALCQATGYAGNRQSMLLAPTFCARV
jgi:hypothetical protein